MIWTTVGNKYRAMVTYRVNTNNKPFYKFVFDAIGIFSLFLEYDKASWKVSSKNVYFVK